MANKKYITETWGEASIRVPEIQKYIYDPLSESAAYILELVDSKPGYSLFCFHREKSGALFVFKAGGAITQGAKEGHD